MPPENISSNLLKFYTSRQMFFSIPPCSVADTCDLVVRSKVTEMAPVSYFICSNFSQRRIQYLVFLPSVVWLAIGEKYRTHNFNLPNLKLLYLSNENIHATDCAFVGIA